MADAPLLKADGALVFASPEAFRQHYEQYLKKGGALVRPEATLAPLQVITVKIDLPSSASLELEAEVTSLSGPLCLLHFTDLSGETASKLQAAAVGPVKESAEELLKEVASLVAQMPSEDQVPARPPPAPSTAASPTPAIAIAPPRPLTPATPMQMRAPAPPTPATPFPTQMAPPTPAGTPAPAAQVRAPTPHVGATPVPGTPGQPVPAEALAPTPVPGAAADARAAATTASAQLLKGERPFKNPNTPYEFLALPLLRPTTPDESQPPAVPTVLQWLSLLKAQGLLVKVKSPRAREVAMYVVWGQDVRTSTGFEALVRSLSEPEGTLDVSPCAEIPKLPYNVTLSSVRFAVLRELLKHFSEQDLTAAMSARLDMAPKLNAHGTSLLRVLGLSEPQLRMAHRLLDGRQALTMVMHNGIGVRSTFHVIYLEQLLGGLTWVEPPRRESAVVEEMRSLSDRVRADHFAALGLHITSAPRAVDRAYERMKQEYGPGSPGATQAPKLAEEILKHAEEAYAALKTAAGRRQYRKEKFPNVRLDYSAQIVQAQSQLAEMRGELLLALELMEAAIELNPTEQYQAAFRRIQGKATKS